MSLQVILESPTRARLLGFENKKKELSSLLSYTDKKVEFEASRTKKTISKWKGASRSYMIRSMGEEVYRERLALFEQKYIDLKAASKCEALFEDEKGLWTYSGLASTIAEKFNCSVSVSYDLPESGVIPGSGNLKARPYQTLAIDTLLANAHMGPCAISLPTGAGKSLVIQELVRKTGLRTLIMVPSVSIARQLYEGLVKVFTKRYVGLYGDGKKEFNKQIVVGIDDSLAKVAEGHAAYEALSTVDTFIVDESHLVASNTLSKVALELCQTASYRFFVSATQMRNDGLDIVLEGITGPVVYTKTLKELVDEGYLAKPVFKMVCVKTNSGLSTDDAGAMSRAHLYYNPNVYKKAAEIAGNFVQHMKKPVVILVEELEQFSKLLPHFKTDKSKIAFAHGPLTKDTKKLVPEAYHASDAKELVAKFNAGELEILVGTSCIATGTDILVAEAGIYLMGGKSEIKVKQGLGRGTRGGHLGTVFNPWTGKQKLTYTHVDFDVEDGGTVHRHAEARYALYTETYAEPDKVR